MPFAVVVQCVFSTTVDTSTYKAKHCSAVKLSIKLEALLDSLRDPLVRNNNDEQHLDLGLLPCNRLSLSEILPQAINIL